MLSAAGLLPCLLLVGLCAAQGKKPPAPKSSWPLKFTNLKVMKKNASRDEISAVMLSFGESLNLTCAACHRNGFASDSSPRKIKTREMMRMTRDLNKRYKTAQTKVTCWTCHAGKAQPVNTPPAQ